MKRNRATYEAYCLGMFEALASIDIFIEDSKGLPAEYVLKYIYDQNESFLHSQEKLIDKLIKK